MVGLSALFGSPGAAAADDLYERERAERAAAHLGLRLATTPEGKRVAFVRFVRDDVLVDDEPWPTWPNAFHWLTDEDVVERELLIGPGDAYDEERVQESMRNLRALGIFSLVRIVAVEGPTPDAVGLLVYTRDLWSLRLETAFSGVGTSFSGLLQLTERNLFGRDKAVGVRFQYAPKSYRLGEFYADSRLAGERLRLLQSFDVIFDRADGEPEGTAGSLSIGRPFYTLSDTWSWKLAGNYLVYVNRPLRRGEISGRRRSDGATCTPGEPDCLTAVWDDRSVATSASVTYRRGVRYKQSFGFGAGFSDRSVEPNAESALAPGDEADFRRVVLPRVRRQAYPYVAYGLGLPRFAIFENLGTFGQSETIATGPSLGASFSFPLRAFGSSSDSIKFSGDIGYTLAAGRALLDASAGGSSRLEEGRVVDQSLSADLRGATPPWLLGRLVLHGAWLAQRHGIDNTVVTLGGDNGLRGYDADELQVVRGNRVLANLEYRTLPLELAAIHFGAVLFYDVGSVYKSLDRMRFHHGVGAGLRVLFLPVNRNVFRFDFGVPLERGGFRVVFSYGSSQAILLTPAEG